MVNLEQQRAEFAFGVVSQCTSIKGFASTAKDLPTMIQSNGLLATWAFLMARAKNRNAEEMIVRILTVYYCDFHKDIFDENIRWEEITAEKFFTEYLVNDESEASQQLRQLTAAAIIISGWIKRAAEALCEEK